MISLLDTPDHWPVDGWLVFRNLPAGMPQKWYLKPLRDGFRHVELWIKDRGAYVRLDPCFEFPVFQVHLHEPFTLLEQTLKPTFVRVRRSIPTKGLRPPLVFGPVTCVDTVKAALGLRLPFVFTPYQLYRYIKDNGI